MALAEETPVMGVLAVLKLRDEFYRLIFSTTYTVHHMSSENEPLTNDDTPLSQSSHFIKDILEDHLAGPDDNVSSSILSDSVRLSAVMTFFFGIFYLQHVMNRYIVGAAQSSSAA